MLKVLLVGQTPPPYHGQALMIEKTLAGNYGSGTKIFFIRMGFSGTMVEVGKIKARKFFELFRIIYLIFQNRIKYSPEVLFYFPAGPNLIPILRDILILSSTRWLFKETIFHFQASGLSAYYQRSSWVIRLLMRLAYHRPDVSIVLSEFALHDGECFDAKKEIILPNASDDLMELLNEDLRNGPPERNTTAQLIYLGALKESKGILVLLDACKILAERKIPFHLNFVGDFDSPAFQNKAHLTVRNYDLENNVSFLGVLTGKEKARRIFQSDVLCLPSFYESEALPVVIIEAMSLGVPVVATKWRGIPSLIEEGQNGFLVSTRDSLHLAEKLELLLSSSDLRKSIGANGRNLYLQKYTFDTYYKNLQKVFEGLMDRNQDD